MKKFFICLTIFSLLSSLLIPSYKVFALNNDFYSNNDILFYNPDDKTCAETNTNTKTVAGSENLETILKFFTGKGLSLAAAAGIAGNIFQESGYNPADVETKKGETYHQPNATDDYILQDGRGFGIIQWSFTPRQAPLAAMAKERGMGITNINLQLDYTWQEITTSYVPMLTRLNTISSSATIGSASAPMAAAIIFHGNTSTLYVSTDKTIRDVNPGPGFEGSGDTVAVVIENRGRTAENIYNTYKGKIADGTGVTDLTIETTSAYSAASDCSSPSGDSTWPANVEAHGDGWTIKDGVDYSTVACASGSTDAGTYLHPIRKFTIRNCQTNVGLVSSLISSKVLTMVNDAASSGIILTGASWRSYEDQVAARESNCPNPETSKANDCEPPTAKAGDSQHEKGLAIDFSTIGKVGSGAEWDWLVANGAKYGFYNLPSEGWHWSMSGS